MKVFETAQIRNIALVGQRGCGKTSLADAIAFSCGITNRLGKVDEGTSLSDFTDAEIAKKTSISLSILACPWKSLKVNVIDLPGHPDFIGEVIAGMNVADTAIMVLNANPGIEVGTEIHYKYIEKYHIPRLFFVNKVEKEHVKVSEVIDQLQSRFGVNCVPVQLPIGEGLEYKGLIDLIKMKAVTFDNSGKAEEGDIPANMKGRAEELHQKLVEAVAEADDALLEKFFDKGELTDDEFRKGLKKAIVTHTVFPILFGSSDKNSGVSTLLNFAQDYLPAPSDMPDINLLKAGKSEIVGVKINPDERPLAYIFKSLSEAHVGEIALFKVFTGKVAQGIELYNANRSTGERIGQIYSISGKNRNEVQEVHAGDIAAMVKLKSTGMGDTLGDKAHPLVVPQIDYPEPPMDTGIKPISKGDEEKVSTALQKIHDNDPSFKVVIDPVLKQTVIFSQGSTHIDNIIEKMKEKFGVEVSTFKPRIPYRETIKGKTEIQHRYKKQSGGRGQYGDVHLRLEPNERGKGFEFLDEVKGGVIPNKYIPSVEKGVVEAMDEGGLARMPVVDIRVAVFYGSYHAVDSSDMAFKIAGSMAFKEGFLKCRPVLLEPIFNVEIIVPDDYTGDVMGDVSSRRGKIGGMDPEGRYQKIKAQIPQAELYNYSVDLRSMTSGQGFYTRSFSHYEEVPNEVQEKIIEDIKKSQTE